MLTRNPAYVRDSVEGLRRYTLRISSFSVFLMDFTLCTPSANRLYLVARSASITSPDPLQQILEASLVRAGSRLARWSPPGQLLMNSLLPLRLRRHSAPASLARCGRRSRKSQLHRRRALQGRHSAPALLSRLHLKRSYTTHGVTRHSDLSLLMAPQRTERRLLRTRQRRRRRDVASHILSIGEINLQVSFASLFILA